MVLSPRAVTDTDVAVAPATGTPETGGWSTRELRTILRGLDGINLIAADIVEVAVSARGLCGGRGGIQRFHGADYARLCVWPASRPYDTNAELTTMAAADALYEIMSIMVKKGSLSLVADDTETDL